MSVLQVAYEAPMLVDLDETAGDCSLGGVCITGGGAIAAIDLPPIN